MRFSRPAPNSCSAGMRCIFGLSKAGMGEGDALITRARHRAENPEMETSGDMNEDRDAMSAQLSDWLSGQIWRKPPRR